MNTEQIFEYLRKFDTPTICNALELPMGGRTAEGFTRGTPVVSSAKAGSFVGYAKTARIEGTKPSAIDRETVNALRLEYYRYAATDPKPGVMVIEDTDWPECIGAFWGEINVAVHKGLGNAGTLTNGIVRDLDAVDPDYQVVAGSIGPSHAHVRVTEIDIPVTVFGLRIHPGDIIHADRHGAVIIPAEHLAVLPAAVDEVIAKESPVIGAAKRADFDIEKLIRVWKDFQQYKPKITAGGKP